MPRPLLQEICCEVVASPARLCPGTHTLVRQLTSASLRRWPTKPSMLFRHVSQQRNDHTYMFAQTSGLSTCLFLYFRRVSIFFARVFILFTVAIFETTCLFFKIRRDLHPVCTRRAPWLFLKNGRQNSHAAKLRSARRLFQK